MPSNDLPGSPGLLVSDIKPCAACGNGIGTSVAFYAIDFEQHILDDRAIRTIVGLEALVGNVLVARALSPVDRISRVMVRNRVLICQTCMLGRFTDLAVLAWPERLAEPEAAEGSTDVCG